MNEPTKALAILIVEDMESDAQLIVRLLKKAGYELVYEQVETAGQMRAALEKHAWDIVISDYKLPGFDGRAALKLLQETGRDVPFIVVSGTIGEETAVAMMKAGAHDYLIKGDLARLVPAVEREFNQAEIRRERKRAEERFELVKDSIDAASDGVYWMDREGWFIYVNDAGCKALGYGRDELLQIRVFDVNPHLTVHRWAELWQVLRDKKVFTTESVHRRKDGSEFPVELTSNYIIFGEQEYVNEFARDITERARVEEALRESEERYRSLFDRMLDGMYRSTHAGKFVDINPAMVKMFGYSSKEEMLEIDIKKELYFDPAERGSHILDTGQQETEVYRMRRKDGSEIWVEDRGYYVHDDQGRIAFHEGMLRDVTERVQARDALAASEAELRALFASMRDVVLVIDHDGLYRKIAPTNPSLLVKPPAELLGKNLRDVFSTEQAETFIGAIRQVLDTKQTAQIEYELLIGDRTVWFETFISPMDKDSTLWVARDVSERRQVQDALRESEQRYKMVSELASDYVYKLGVAADGKITLDFVTDSFYSITGRSMEQARTLQSWSSIFHPDDLGKAMEFLHGLIITRRAGELECRTYISNNQLRWVGIIARPEWDEQENRVTAIVGAVKDITERKQAEEDIRQRIIELEVLYESGLVLSQLLNPKEIGRKMIELLEEKLNWHHTTIRLYHPNDESLELLAFNQPGLVGKAEERAVEGRFNRLISRSGEGLSGWAVKNFQAVRSGDVSNDPRYAETFPGLHSGLYVPIRLGDRMIGVISIESEQPDAFSEADERLVTTLANQAASAFENARLFEAERKQHQMSDALRDALSAGASLSASLDYETVLDHLLETLERVVPFDGGCIMLVLPNLQKINIARVRGYQKYEKWEIENISKLSFDLSSTKNLRWMLENKRPLVIPDVVQYPGWIHFQESNYLRSWAGAPIIVNDEVIAFFSLDGSEPNYFANEDVELLRAFAGQASLAMQNARLFEETRQRVMELEMLYQSGLALSQLLNPKEIGQKTLDLLKEKLGWQHTRIRLYHPQDDSLELLDFNQPGLMGETKRREVVERFQTLITHSGQGMNGWVVQHGQPVRLGDVSNDPRYIEAYPGIRSGLYVPMKLGERMVGVISVESEQPDAFNEADERLAATLANQAASAFENARLFESTQRHVSELTTLHRASQTLLAARLDPEHIYDAVHQAVAQTMPCEAFVIVLDDEDGGDYHAVYFFDKGERYAPKRLPRGAGLSGHIISLGKSLLVDDLKMENDLPMTHFGSQEIVRSVLAVPLRRGDEIIGMLSTQSYQPYAFSKAQCLLLETITAQLASAVDNAHLYQQTQARLKELEALHEVSVSLRTAQTLEEALPILLDETLAALETDSGSIFLYHPETDDLQDTFARGWFKDIQNIPIKPGEGVPGTVFATGQVYFSQEFVRDTFPHAATRDKMPAGWGGACLPIRAGSESVGVLFVSVRLPRQITSGQLKLLNSLAEITGATLHRMRLFDETARRAEEFASLYETSKILSAENELDSLLQTIVEHAKTLLHAVSSGVYLYDKEREELEVVVDSDTAPYAVTGTRLRLGEGAAGQVAQTRQPMRIADYSAWEGHSQKYAGVPFRAVLEVPMLYGGELVGVLTADETGDSERKFTETDERLLSLFASQAAGAIHSARLHKETVHRLEHLQALRAVDQAIASSLDMRLTLKIILTHTLPQLGVDAADVLLLRSSSNLLEFIAGHGFRTRMPEGASVGVGESFAGRAIMEHRTIIAFDLKTAEQNPQFGKFWKEEGFAAYWCVPLIVKGEARGALEVYRRTTFTPDAEWLEFLETLAGQAGIAIENTQLFENLQRANMDLSLAYNATIEGWSRALDLRDKETEGHTQRVADLTVAIAKIMGIKDQGMLHIRRGALLHDIGKMGIPDHILLKPDKLTNEEWVIMRTHPQLARDMLMPIAYLRDALDIPYSHHEKWDGTGYPQRLKGQQIPLSARLFAVVDVWDALTSDRPYRKKWTKKKALAYIYEQSGKHFDPQVVDAFVKIIKVN